MYNSITDEFEDLGFGEGTEMRTIRANIYKESLLLSMQMVQQVKLSEWVHF